jgi:butyryl-CoA dehydrogenase
VNTISSGDKVTSSICFKLSEEQEMIRQMTAEFADNEIKPFVAEWDREDHVPMEVLNKMYDLGLTNMESQLNTAALALIISQDIQLQMSLRREMQALPQQLLPHPFLQQIQSGCSKSRAKKWWFGRMMEGAMCAFCLTEPEAGSDALGLSTRCIKDGNDWIISGTKQFITNGGICKTIYSICNNGQKPWQ